MTENAQVIGRSGSYAKGTARRQEILDRAIEVFAERGAHGTSLRQIAKSIGVSHAALLHYFDSREQLLVAVYEHAESLRAGTLPPETSAVDLMRDAAKTNAGVPGLVQLYTTLVATSLEEQSTDAKGFFTARFAGSRADLTEQFTHEQQEGRIRSDIDPKTLASLLIAASDGLQTQWLLDPSVDLGEALATFGELLKPHRPD